MGMIRLYTEVHQRSQPSNTKDLQYCGIELPIVTPPIHTEWIFE